MMPSTERNERLGASIGGAMGTSTSALPSIELRTGARIPQVGLGVWQTPRGRATQSAVASALRVGYRHIDTAKIYGNEEDVGIAIVRSGIARDQLFVTTKLWNSDQGYDSALRAFDASLERLGLDYVDLYLIHWPVAGKRLESWRALEKIYETKRASAIGVSNYLRPHLEELLGSARVPPAVNQIELSPFLQRRDAVALCRKNSVLVEAYSPLTHGRRLENPVVLDVARRVERSPAQVLLRWGIQKELVVLPKSSRADRIVENASLFDFALDAHSMAALDALEEGLVTGWDPATQA
jgi:diketogulonate reductase-like aldo/keto reductase